MEVIPGVARRDFPQTLEAFLTLIHPEDRPGLGRALTRCVEAGADYATEYRGIWPDGSVHWVESTAHARRNDAGRTTRIVGIDRDITARKLAEAALVESERAYRSTFDGAPVGLAHVSLDGRWLRVNRRLCEILGYAGEELLTLDVLTLLHPEDLADVSGGFGSLAAGSLDRYHGEKRLRRRDGSFVWTLLNVSVHRDELGKAKYIIPIIRCGPTCSSRSLRPRNAAKVRVWDLSPYTASSSRVNGTSGLRARSGAAPRSPCISRKPCSVSRACPPNRRPTRGQARKRHRASIGHPARHPAGRRPGESTSRRA